jgi:hypothetical protein
MSRAGEVQPLHPWPRRTEARHLGYKAWRYEFEVVTSYRREFPIDMLRYDGCFPLEERDALAIARSIRGDDMTAEDARIHLVAYHESGGWKPTAARWESFGWKLA